MELLVELIKTDTTTKKLVLRGRGITTEGAMHIFKALCVNTTLTALDLSHNLINDEGLASLAVSLNVNKSLKILNVSHNKFTVLGASLLIASLKKNRVLEVIGMKQFRFHQIGERLGPPLISYPLCLGREFRNILEKNTRLTVIDAFHDLFRGQFGAFIVTTPGDKVEAYLQANRELKIFRDAVCLLIGIRRQNHSRDGMGVLSLLPKEIVRMIALFLWDQRPRVDPNPDIVRGVTPY